MMVHGPPTSAVPQPPVTERRENESFAMASGATAVTSLGGGGGGAVVVGDGQGDRVGAGGGVVRVAFFPVPEVPSPKSHEYPATVPSVSVEALASNVAFKIGHAHVERRGRGQVGRQ